MEIKSLGPQGHNMFVWLGFLIFFWRYDTSSNRVAVDIPPRGSKMAATRDNQQPSRDSCMCVLNSQLQAGKFPLQSCSTTPVTKTKGPKRLAKHFFSQLFFWKTIVVLHVDFRTKYRVLEKKNLIWIDCHFKANEFFFWFLLRIGETHLKFYEM